MNARSVVVTDVLEGVGREAAAAIEAAGGGAEFHPLDVRSTEAADAVVAKVLERHGRIDVIVASAGIAHRVPLDRLTDEKWHLTHDVDLKGMLRVIRPALPAMRAAKRGSIVCLSSIMGVAYGWDEHVAYSAAKAGVVGLVRGLATELARDGVRANGIAPGYIRTAQLLSAENSLGPDADRIASPYISMGRLGEPGEIGRVIQFLASSAASYLTGQVLTVASGLLVGRY